MHINIIHMTELLDIKSPRILYIIKTIKQIQARMNDLDIRDLDEPHTYQTLSYEFDEFFERYTQIFIKVIRGEDLNILSANLFYLDKVDRELMTEAEIADKLASKYLPETLKKESDIKLKEMKAGK